MSKLARVCSVVGAVRRTTPALRNIAMNTLAYTIAEACTGRMAKPRCMQAIKTGERRAVKRGRRTVRASPPTSRNGLRNFPLSSASGKARKHGAGLTDETRSERGGARPRQCGRGCISATRPNAKPALGGNRVTGETQRPSQRRRQYRSEEQPQSETRWVALVGALEAVDSHPRRRRELRSKRCGSHSEETE